MSPFLPFALPDITEEEIELVSTALRSGWLTTGPKTREFEQLFSQFLGGEVQCIAVNSATSGLHLALEALGIGPGDEVIVPTNTFTATAEVVRYLGADVVIVDIDPKTYLISLDAIKKAFTPKTKAIIPVHFSGLAVDMDPLLAFAQAHGLKVVEDAAHSLPTTYKGRMVGNLSSDVTVFSFYATKTLCTGEGGMVVTKSEALAQHMKMMRLHGINRDVFDRYQAKGASWYYEVVAPGFKYNLTDVASCLGIVQLKRIWEMQKKREEIAQKYMKAFQSPFIVLPTPPSLKDIHAWHLFPVQINHPRVSRDDFISQMLEASIGTSVHFIPLHKHPYWKEKYQLEASSYPCAEEYFKNCVSLPIFSKMTHEDVERVIFQTKSILGL